MLPFAIVFCLIVKKACIFTLYLQVSEGGRSELGKRLGRGVGRGLLPTPLPCTPAVSLALGEGVGS